MTNVNEKKNKHMTLQDRIEIQECLDKGMSFKVIACRIQKDQTTVSKEVKKHIVKQPYGKNGNASSGVETLCPQLRKVPFVCNPCPKKRYCRQTRYLYEARKAHQEYLSVLSETREGIPLGKKQFYDNDKIITKGIKQGQHLYHILQTNDLKVSKSMVYRHLQKAIYPLQLLICQEL